MTDSILPPGVTRRHLNMLASRGAPLTLGGTAVVCCVHGRVKRENADAFVCDAADYNAGRVVICPCCQNLFVNRGDEVARCDTCTPRRKPR